jgi:hypothetical protein
MKEMEAIGYVQRPAKNDDEAASNSELSEEALLFIARRHFQNPKLVKFG